MATLKGAIKAIKGRAKRWQDEKPAREQAKLDKLRAKTAREKEKARLNTERLKAKQDVVEAKTRLNKAKARQRKSRKKGGKLLDGFFGEGKKRGRKKKTALW